MGWIRWWLSRRGNIQRLDREVERILRWDAALGQPAWSCRYCAQTVQVPADHAASCSLYQPWR